VRKLTFLPSNIFSRLMKNPADMRYIEKKVCAIKQDMVKVGAILDDSMARDRLQ
jgi:hypothetical protein